MSQKDAWEREYRKPVLVSLGEEPQADVKNFLRFLRREQGVNLETIRMLDLGSGTGKNSIHIAGLGGSAVGLEISQTAVDIARKRANAANLTNVEFKVRDIGEAYPFGDEAFDLALDIMTSNSLDEEERHMYLRETHRVLKAGGYFFVRGLCKDGDKNAKNLLRISPGPEKDTYINTDMNLTERVFTEEDFRTTYSPLFTILSLEKKTNYAQCNGRIYKRNYWLAYMKKDGK